MEIVITMAGRGKRFLDAGYTVPKYMIKAFDKSLFEWSMESLEGFKSLDNNYYFIVRKEDNSGDFIKASCAKMGINRINIIEIDYVTDGQATTAMLAAPMWNVSAELMIYNIDTYVESYAMKASDIEGDGFLPCFKGEGDHWSFVKLDDNGDATEVAEKKRISDNCTLGAYYFSTAGLYEDIYREYYGQNQNLTNGEKYVAPLYNYMIDKGMKVRISDVDADKVHVLGTPEELDVFLKSGIGNS